MADVDLAKVNTLFPKVLGKTVRARKFQSKFKKRIDAAAEVVKYKNPAGNNMQFVTTENASLFSVAEGGQILNGSPVGYTDVKMDIRKMWKSGSYTGDVERQLDANIADIEMARNDLAGNMPELNRMGHNRLVRDLIFSTLNLYAHHENYFALQGTNKSTIGVVTALPGTLGAGNVGFSWASTSQGNRMFHLNQQIQFYDSASPTQRVAGMSAENGGYFSTVDVKPDHRASTNATNGVTHFTNLPTNLAVGDTAHFRNAYGALPEGFVRYVDDGGDYKGKTRSDNPDIFASYIDRRTGSPTLNPSIMFENESFLEGKLGYGKQAVVEVWMNKAQRQNYISNLYNSGSGFAYTRWVDAGRGGGRIDNYDPSVKTDDLKFGKWNIEIDEHVPPAELFFINFASWKKYERTPVKAYAFDSGSYLINPIDQYGIRLDAKMFTIFSEYNWDCIDPTSNSRVTGLGFDSKHVMMP